MTDSHPKAAPPTKSAPKININKTNNTIHSIHVEPSPPRVRSAECCRPRQHTMIPSTRFINPQLQLTPADSVPLPALGNFPLARSSLAVLRPRASGAGQVALLPVAPPAAAAQPASDRQHVGQG